MGRGYFGSAVQDHMRRTYSMLKMIREIRSNQWKAAGLSE